MFNCLLNSSRYKNFFFSSKYSSYDITYIQLPYTTNTAAILFHSKGHCSMLSTIFKVQSVSQILFIAIENYTVREQYMHLCDTEPVLTAGKHKLLRPYKPHICNRTMALVRFRGPPHQVNPHIRGRSSSMVSGFNNNGGGKPLFFFTCGSIDSDIKGNTT